ncbi:MAG: hypothetical protein MZV65_13875 [Chromatiales bacterium]|nr:hypothetical protein [Chromatiales bacterium]
MGGHVPFMFDGPATSIPMIKGGKLQGALRGHLARPLCTTLPDVPTFAELGYKDHDATPRGWACSSRPDVPAAVQAAPA